MEESQRLETVNTSPGRRNNMRLSRVLEQIEHAVPDKNRYTDELNDTKIPKKTVMFKEEISAYEPDTKLLTKKKGILVRKLRVPQPIQTEVTTTDEPTPDHPHNGRHNFMKFMEEAKPADIDYDERHVTSPTHHTKHLSVPHMRDNTSHPVTTAFFGGKSSSNNKESGLFAPVVRPFNVRRSPSKDFEGGNEFNFSKYQPAALKENGNGSNQYKHLGDLLTQSQQREQRRESRGGPASEYYMGNRINLTPADEGKLTMETDNTAENVNNSNYNYNNPMNGGAIFNKKVSTNNPRLYYARPEGPSSLFEAGSFDVNSGGFRSGVFGNAGLQSLGGTKSSSLFTKSTPNTNTRPNHILTTTGSTNNLGNVLPRLNSNYDQVINKARSINANNSPRPESLATKVAERLGIETMVLGTLVVCYNFPQKCYYVSDLASYVGFLQMYAFVHIGGGALLVCGGVNIEMGELSSKVYKYDIANHKLSDLPGSLTRFGHTLVHIEDRNEVIALGGYHQSGQARIKNVELYSMTGKKWTSLPPMRHERANCVAVYNPSNKCIYVFGGCLKEADNIFIEKFDTIMHVWSVLPISLDYKFDPAYLRVVAAKSSRNRGMYDDCLLVIARDRSLNRIIDCRTERISKGNFDICCADAHEQVVLSENCAVKLRTKPLGECEVVSLPDSKKDTITLQEKIL